MSFRSRDPIHNFIRLPAELAPVVNAGVLQRLRGIRQLALASLVYPGALHTRFDHTLGVAHVAGLIAEQLSIDGDEFRLTLLAGLLHDIGHGPFSHVSEASLERFGDASKRKPDQAQHKIHEAVTAELIRSDPELGRLLTDDERERVVRLLGDWDGRPVLKQIVSGPLDADKQDYLLRDSYFCGVRYGHYDLHQLLRSLVLPEADGTDLMIGEDGVQAVEQFILAKYYMTTNVYGHRVRQITDQMITRAIRLGIETDRLEEMGRLYGFDGSREFIRNYVQWDDGRFLETFCPSGRTAPGPKSGALLRRLRERNLLKRVFRAKIDVPFDGRHKETLRNLSRKAHDGVRLAIEQGVCDILRAATGQDIDPDFVVAHGYAIKSVRESARNDAKDILVNMRPAPQYLTEQASTLLTSINAANADSFIEVYAPVAWPGEADKDALREAWGDPIRDAIQTACKRGKI